MLSPFIILLIIICVAFLVGLAVYAIIQAVANKRTYTYTISGGCQSTRWGCCPDMITPKYDINGSNCIPLPYPQHKGMPNSSDSAQTQKFPSQ